MTGLTPQAYIYLRHPILSSGETMLYHTIQHLCFTGALKVHYEDVRVGRSGRTQVTRLFLSQGAAPATDARAETFAWKLFPADRAITLVDLRRIIEDKVEDPEEFKSAHMYPDLKARGLLRGRYFRTAEGVEACRHTHDLLFTVEKDIGLGLEGGWERSFKHVQALRSCIVLLDEEARDALKEGSPRRSGPGGRFFDPALPRTHTWRW